MKLTLAPHIAALMRPTLADLPDGQFPGLPVQPPLQKYFLFSSDPNHRLILDVPSHLRGGSRSSRTRDGMRWTLVALMTNSTEADGEVVWS
jgi:hypothetical protein